MSLCISGGHLVVGIGDKIVLRCLDSAKAGSYKHISGEDGHGKGNPIVCLSDSARDSECVYAGFSNKRVVCFNLRSMSISSSVTMSKRPTAMLLASASSHPVLVASDRMGEIWGMNAADLTA